MALKTKNQSPLPSFYFTITVIINILVINFVLGVQLSRVVPSALHSLGSVGGPGRLESALRNEGRHAFSERARRSRCGFSASSESGETDRWQQLWADLGRAGGHPQRGEGRFLKSLNPESC